MRPCSAATRLVLLVATTFGTFVVGVMGDVSRQPTSETVWVDTPRPLAAATRELEERHGWIVTYEDITYAYSEDRREYTPQTGGSRAVGPRGGFFVFHYPADEVRGPEPRLALANMLDWYHNAELPGRFRVLESESALQEKLFHVVPRMSRDADGRWQPERALLDVRISLPEEERLSMQMLQDLVRAVSRTTGRKLEIGTAPFNSFINTLISGAAADETARDVLVRALASTGRRDLSWQLLCHPAPGDCMLNVNVVGHERFAADIPTPRWAPSAMPR